MTGNTFNNSAYLANTATLGGGVTIGGGGGTSTPHLNYTISNNTFKFAKNINFGVAMSGGTADFTGTISNNTFGTATEAGSGSDGYGLNFNLQGNGTSKATIQNNSMYHYKDAGLYIVVNRGTADYAGVSAKFQITGNTVGSPDAPNVGQGTAGLGADIGFNSTDASVACLDISGNTMNGSKPTNGSADVLMGATGGGFIDMPSYPVVSDNGAASVNYIQGRNVNGASTTVLAVSTLANHFRQVAAGACA